MNKPADIYLDRSRKTLLDLIAQLLQFSEAVIYLEGPAGSGRTTLLELARRNFIQLEDSGHELQVIDDADELNPAELLHQIEHSSNCRFLLSGLPGSSRLLKELLPNNTPALERISIAPFTRPDAEYFLVNHCPAVPKRHRQAILNRERLYPQQLIQATYLQELSQRGFTHRYSRLSALAAIIILFLIWFAIIRGLVFQSNHDAEMVDEGITDITRTRVPKPQPVGDVQSKVVLARPIDTNYPITRSEPPQAGGSSPVLVPINETEAVPKFTQPVFSTTKPAPPIALAETALMARQPNHVTIQLMQASDPDNITKLRNRHDLDPTFVYLRQVGQQRLYCLLLGDYPSMEAAATALRSLPQELRDLGPWRRTFVAVQDEISALSH